MLSKMVRNEVISKGVFLVLLVFFMFVFFVSNAHADLYLNSKVGSIYFNTSGVARASIGPGGNFSINTSDFFVNQKNLEFGFLDANKFHHKGICCTANCNSQQFACDRRADLMRHDRHTNLGRVGGLDE